MCTAWPLIIAPLLPFGGKNNPSFLRLNEWENTVSFFKDGLRWKHFFYIHFDHHTTRKKHDDGDLIEEEDEIRGQKKNASFTMSYSFTLRIASIHRQTTTLLMRKHLLKTFDPSRVQRLPLKSWLWWKRPHLQQHNNALIIKRFLQHRRRLLTVK